MFGHKFNPAVLFAVLTLGAGALVFWATWSALQHQAAPAPTTAATKILPVELLGLLSWGMTAAYGAWIAVTGQKVGDVPRNLTGRTLRAVGGGELVLSIGAVWAILSQPASTLLYGFGVLLGILTVGIGVPLAIRGRSRRTYT